MFGKQHPLNLKYLNLKGGGGNPPTCNRDYNQEFKQDQKNLHIKQYWKCEYYWSRTAKKRPYHSKEWAKTNREQTFLILFKAMAWHK